ncbi:MAG: hypothetical protein KDI55_29750, partial [Anaerolineae bacterium]|nr:hypothetical protein [Anaerolineae bacterium]
GLATTANYLPVVASSDDVDLFHAGFVAAINAVAVSLSIELDMRPTSGSRMIIIRSSKDTQRSLIE